jgi:hypothetical protein
MSMHRNHLTPLMASLSFVLACGGMPSGNAAQLHDHPPSTPVADVNVSEVNSQLDKLRKDMARYVSFSNARKDGYTTAITGCMSNQPVGAMGVHYGKPSIIDSLPQAMNPEVLLYEPGRGGKQTFVGVEFIVPFSAWTKPTPPVLYGQTFAANQTFQVWALHVWVGRTNPSGIFADWNPTVSC